MKRWLLLSMILFIIPLYGQERLKEEEAQAKLAELKQKEATLNAKIKELEDQVVSLESEISALDSKISELTAEIDKLRAALPKLRYETYVVKPGDMLRSISEKFYGGDMCWKKIFDANRDIIKDPDLILPGWELKIPIEE